MKKNLSILCLLCSFITAACASAPPPEPTAAVRFVTVTPAPPTTSTPTPTPPTIPTLRDVAAEAGLDFRHGAFRESLAEDPVAMMGGGLCWLDVEADGWLDLYVVNSHSLHEVELWQNEGGLPSNALFRNQGDGTFEDISAASGTDLALRGNGCIAGDIDQDGDSDIYITADGPNKLLLNQGDGTFREGAEAAGVAAAEWNSAAAMGDVNGDGLVDLYVASFIDLDKKIPEPIGLFPQDYYGLADHLYLNQGDGTFRDVAAEVGLTDEERGLGALFSDFDRDGDLDLYVANDGQPNRLYRNDGSGRFTENSQALGVDDRGSGMGVGAGDYNGDGWFDVVVTNFDKEYNALYRNDSGPASDLAFEYATFKMGIQGFGQNQTGWGVTWLDLDLDSHLDLLTVQGKVPITDLAADGEPIRFYHNRGDATFFDFSRQIGAQEIGPQIARGLAAADYDNDGDMDVAVATIGGPLLLLQNSGASGNWLTVDLADFAPGTRLTATLPDGRTLTQELRCGSSYLASEDPRFHLGLGAAEQVRLDITLPDGEMIAFSEVAANQIFRVTTSR